MSLKKNYPFFEKGKFKNYQGEEKVFSFSDIYKLLWSVVKSRITSKSIMSESEYKLRYSETNFDISLLYQYHKTPFILPMGHASILISYKGLNILFDPLFFSSSIFLKRYVPCIPEYQNLPNIDAVFISHNHPDHCDYRSLSLLYDQKKNIEIHAPLGTRDIFKTVGFKNITEYTWWQEEQISVFKEHNIFAEATFVPSFHWSQHFLGKYNKSLWGGFVLQLDSYIIYFCGDTAYSDNFKRIAHYFPNIDCALIPIAPFEPEDIIQKTHMTIDESVQACLDINATSYIPIHWGVLRLGPEELYEPIELFKKKAAEHKFFNKLGSVIIGSPYKLPDKKASQIKEKKDATEISIENKTLI